MKINREQFAWIYWTAFAKWEGSEKVSFYEFLCRELNKFFNPTKPKKGKRKTHAH